MKDNMELSLDHDTDDLSKFLSPVYSLYFQSMKFSFLVCLIITIISGFYNMYDNSRGDYCLNQEEYINSNTTSNCLLGFVTKYSMANQMNKPQNVQDQGFIGLITIAVLILVLQICRKNQRKMILDCDERAVTPSDYTIRVYNFPKFFDENCDVDEEIKRFFENHGLPGKKLEVKHVSVIYDCSEKIELGEKIKKKTLEKIKLNHRLNSKINKRWLIQRWGK